MYGYYNLFKYYPDKVMQIKTVEDIETAKKAGKLGVIFSLQNSAAMGQDFYKWSIMAELGLKICQLTYMEPNLYGSGCLDKANQGITYWGEQAIREMNRQGIVVDLSHVGERTSLEAIDYSSKPCIFSHSNALSVCPTSNRNLTDEMIKNCCSQGRRYLPQRPRLCLPQGSRRPGHPGGLHRPFRVSGQSGGRRSHRHRYGYL